MGKTLHVGNVIVKDSLYLSLNFTMNLKLLKNMKFYILKLTYLYLYGIWRYFQNDSLTHME